MIRVFLSHSGADLALTEGAIELLSGLKREPLVKLLRTRIELPSDVDTFADRISALQRDSDFFVFVLFSRTWKITNAVRLARRLADARPKSAALCEREWGQDPRNLEPFSGFDSDLLNFAPEQISRRIESRLGSLRASPEHPDAAHRLSLHSQRTASHLESDDRADAELARCEEQLSPLESEDIIASVGVEASGLPSLAELMRKTGQTGWDPEIDPADDIDVQPGVVAAMRRLAEQGYGLDDEGPAPAHPPNPRPSGRAKP